ncbi:hypothetical protein BU24DRAFT_150739 [Aaosphaeria arxii CBS 175.79]|uniref:Uncharacterized protein n=1 Tax=Aaosphaeria arxii CBS 175.79 TaxID=1450172 RepID=A0A6A5XXI6_9PLEO|nr:uncharacterized protein BU24DRAFT_150739 [Aaosphaeria arxii CBS 175.79]KAF2017441.1 hypothetical protein BU24DRAFT_150739 [Aaosphaeria arxii CBS 175.79]
MVSELGEIMTCNSCFIFFPLLLSFAFVSLAHRVYLLAKNNGVSAVHFSWDHSSCRFPAWPKTTITNGEARSIAILLGRVRPRAAP